MKKILSVLLFLSFSAYADIFRVEDGSGSVLRLFEEPCDQVFPWGVKLRKAELKYGGKEYKACWFIIGRDVIVFDEAGDVSKVPINQFSKELSA